MDHVQPSRVRVIIIFPAHPTFLFNTFSDYASVTTQILSVLLHHLIILYNILYYNVLDPTALIYFASIARKGTICLVLLDVYFGTSCQGLSVVKRWTCDAHISPTQPAPIRESYSHASNLPSFQLSIQ
jgi:hypothetical protein